VVRSAPPAARPDRLPRYVLRHCQLPGTSEPAAGSRVALRVGGTEIAVPVIRVIEVPPHPRHAGEGLTGPAISPVFALCANSLNDDARNSRASASATAATASACAVPRANVRPVDSNGEELIHLDERGRTVVTSKVLDKGDECLDDAASRPD
jgi:hypothetical protein